jgi:hypothetical protein
MSRRCLGTLSQLHHRHLNKHPHSSKHNNLLQHPSLYRTVLLFSINPLRMDTRSPKLNLDRILSLCTAIRLLSKDILSR